MPIPATIQTFHFANTTVQAYIPSNKWMQKQFEKEDTKAAVPYWAQVWPAAKALCEVIAAEPSLIKNKKVLELAAGLGLPSLLAAQFAKEVIASDYMEEAVGMMKRSASHNGLKNMQCRVIDWNSPDANLTADVLLLSDINYDPKDFDVLYKVLDHFIKTGSTVLLSTPQRLVAKSFTERLQHWCIKKYNIEIVHKEETVFTTVLALANDNNTMSQE